jgi:hypothetical protein
VPDGSTSPPIDRSDEARRALDCPTVEGALASSDIDPPTPQEKKT